MFARRQDCRTWGSCRIVVIDTSSTWSSSSWTSINNIFFFFFFLFCCNFFHLDIEVAWIADSIDGSIGSWCCSDAWRYRCVVRTGESLCCDSCIENETAVSSAFAIGNSNARWTKDQIHVINIYIFVFKKNWKTIVLCSPPVLRGETRTTTLMFQVPKEAMHSFNYMKANCSYELRVTGDVAGRDTSISMGVVVQVILFIFIIFNLCLKINTI